MTQVEFPELLSTVVRRKTVSWPISGLHAVPELKTQDTIASRTVFGRSANSNDLQALGNPTKKIEVKTATVGASFAQNGWISGVVAFWRRQMATGFTEQPPGKHQNGFRRIFLRSSWIVPKFGGMTGIDATNPKKKIEHY